MKAGRNEQNGEKGKNRRQERRQERWWQIIQEKNGKIEMQNTSKKDNRAQGKIRKGSM